LKKSFLHLETNYSDADRVSAMVRRVGRQPKFVFAGGVAYNPCMRQLLAHDLGITLTVPENPQTVGALGAAIYAAQTLN